MAADIKFNAVPTSPPSLTPPALTAPAPPLPSPRKIRWAVRLFAVLVVLAVASFGVHWFNQRLAQSITEDAFVEAHIVNVAPEMVSGRIVRLLVEENDRVEQGQALAEIEPVHYQDQVNQARGKFELAEAELERQKAGLAKLKKEVPLQIEVAEQTLAGARTD